MKIARLLGNRVLVRFLDRPKIVAGLHLPNPPPTPIAVVVQRGEGRVGLYGSRRARYLTNHALELLGQVEVGNVVRVNLQRGNVPVIIDGEELNIVSMLDVQAVYA